MLNIIIKLEQTVIKPLAGPLVCVEANSVASRESLTSLRHHGVSAMLVHALNDRVKAFYVAAGHDEFPVDPTGADPAEE